MAVPLFTSRRDCPVLRDAWLRPTSSNRRIAADGQSPARPVPQDQEGNFVQIDDLDWSNEGGKHDPELQVAIDVVTIYRGENRSELLAIMHANYRALIEAPIEAEGVTITGVQLLGGFASGAGPDGLTYAGLQSFVLFAEPA